MALRSRLGGLALIALLPGHAAAAAPPACDPERYRTAAAIRGINGDPVPPGETVTVSGQVAGAFLGADALEGVFLQNTAGRTGGVFVYIPEPDEAWRKRLRGGRRVVVRAKTDRFHGRTQLHEVTAVTDCGAGEPRTTNLEWPADEARLRSLAGTRVRLAEPLTVTGNHELARYGSLHLAADRLRHPRTDPPGDAERRMLVLDDGADERTPKPIPHLDAAGTRRIGTRVTATGILTRAFGAWRLHPVTEPRFQAANPRPEPPAPPEPATRRLATINLHNYFVTLGERGPDSVTERKAKERALRRLITGLDADALAVTEVANRPRALAALTERVAGADYQLAGSARAIGKDATRTAILYRADRLSAVGPLRTAPEDAFIRPPVAQRFRSAAGHTFTLVTAHFKSKGGCDDPSDPFRGCGTERRKREAAALARWASELPEPVIIAGDLNAQANEAPLRRLQATGFRDLLAAHLPTADRYTYVHQGRSGYLDHLLVRGPTDIAAVGHWATGADEPPGVPEPGTVWAASDHDPVWLDLGGG